MSDKPDNSSSSQDREPKISDSTADTPLEKSGNKEKRPDIDTSHLSLEDADEFADFLESSDKPETTDIDTSHLSLDDSEVEKKPSAADDFDLEDDALAAGPDDEPQQPVVPGSVDDELPENIEAPDTADSETGNLFIANPLASKKPSETEASGSAGDAAQTGTENSDQREIVPEDVVLASGRPDDTLEMEAMGELPKQQQPPGEAGEKTASNEKHETEETPVDAILSTVAKPEEIVKDAWSKSSVRQYLIENVESYRKKDEDRNMEDVIDEVYGGAPEDKFSLGKFIKNNILFTVLVCILIFLIGWKAAEFLFPDLMPGINDQIIETVQQSTSKPKKKTVEKPTVSLNEDNRLAVKQTLSHCLVTPMAREKVDQALAGTGYNFTSNDPTRAYDEISNSIRMWNDMNVDFLVRDSMLRSNELAVLVLPVLQDAHEVVAGYGETLAGLRREADALEQEIRDIQTSKGNQTTATINQRIPLRNKLEKLRDRLEQEPDQIRFSDLLDKINRTEAILAGKETPARITPDELTDKDPSWLITISETESEAIADNIKSDVLPPIQEMADKLKEPYPKLTGFRLSELEHGIDNVLKLSALLHFYPENKLIMYGLGLSGLDRRMNDLFNAKASSWLSIDQCLVEKRASLVTAQ